MYVEYTLPKTFGQFQKILRVNDHTYNKSESDPLPGTLEKDH